VIEFIQAWCGNFPPVTAVSDETKASLEKKYGNLLNKALGRPGGSTSDKVLGAAG
jgi:hypothetical protein